MGEADPERRAQSIEHLSAEFAAYHSLHRLHQAGQFTLLVMGAASTVANASSPRVRCIAPHHASELASLLTAADLVVLPRMEENSPHLVADCFRCGSPVVAFDTGGIAEMVTDGQTGALVPCGDGQRMAETISHLALHRDQLAQWSENCRAAAARLPAPETIAGEYRALYDRLLAQPAAAPAAPVRAELRPGLRAACWQALQPASLDEGRANRADLETLRAEIAQLTSLLHHARQKLAMFMRKLAKPSELAAQSVTVSSEKLRGRLTRLLLESELDAASRRSTHFPRFDGHPNGAPLHDGDSPLFRWLCLRLLKHPANIRLGRFDHHPPRPLAPERFPRARLRAKKLPSIAIVTPSYMQGDFIAQTIESVIGQDYPKLAYTVQDGGSTDGTTGVLRRFSPQLSSWTSHPDTGQSRAVLAGFRKVRGDIMAYLNSDDLLMPGALRYVGEFFRRHPQVDAIYGHRVVIDEHGREVGRWVLPPHDPEILRWVDYVPQETLFWRSQIYEQIGGIDAKFRFALDWDLLLRLEEAGAKIIRVPYFLGCFRVHGQQKTSAQQTTGLEEMTFLRRRTHGRPPRAGELSHAHAVIGRRAAFYALLLRWASASKSRFRRASGEGPPPHRFVLPRQPRIRLSAFQKSR